jgi:LEA14-like dessication related protein
MRSFILLLLSTFVLYSCSAVTAPTIRSIDSIRIESVDDGIVILKAHVTLENPNRISISGKDLHFGLFYKNTSLGTGKCDEAFELNAKASTPLVLDIEMNLDSIPGSLRMGLFEMDSIPLKVKLAFQGKLGFEYTHSGEFKLSMEKLQSALINQYFNESGFEMKDIKLESTNQSKSMFKGNISFSNKLPFDIQILGSEVFVFSERSGGVNVGRFDLADSLIIKKEETLLIPCIITVDNMKAMSSGFGKMLSGSLDYYAMGPMHLNLNELEFKVPVSVHFSFNPLTGKVIILE